MTEGNANSSETLIIYPSYIASSGYNDETTSPIVFLRKKSEGLSEKVGDE